MAKSPAGHIEQLPSGSWRVKVYADTDPLTGREIRLRKTCKTERAAQIELGKLLGQASAGRQPETNATVAEMSALQNVSVATLQHALAVLAEEGLIVICQGRTAVVTGDVSIERRPRRAPRGRDHDHRLAGCESHVCKPLTAKTIRTRSCSRSAPNKACAAR